MSASTTNTAKNKTKKYRPRVTALLDAINSADAGGRYTLASRCGTTVDNLRQIAYGFGACSLNQAVLIANAVDGVTLSDLYPALADVEIK